MDFDWFEIAEREKHSFDISLDALTVQGSLVSSCLTSPEKSLDYDSLGLAGIGDEFMKGLN